MCCVCTWVHVDCVSYTYVSDCIESECTQAMVCAVWDRPCMRLCIHVQCTCVASVCVHMHVYWHIHLHMYVRMYVCTVYDIVRTYVHIYVPTCGQVHEDSVTNFQIISQHA